MNQKILLRSSIALLTAGVMLASVLCFTKADDPRIVKIIQQLENFTKRSNLQKVYLKTDKEKYIVGETIWLKAYVLNALSLKPDVQSNEVFIDLIGRNSRVYQSIIVRNLNGFANGDIIISDSIPEGNYQIVAYTNWMKNFDDAYYFLKNIRIANPSYGNFLTQSSFESIKDYNKKLAIAEKEKTIQFFPEGGYMVSGLQCRIAFKAINKLGDGVNAKGEIFTEDDKRICSIETKHLGMGTFTFTPESGKKYYAKVIFDDGQSKKINLPLAEPKGYVMMVNAIAGDQIRLNIQSNIGNQADEKNNDFLVVGQSRGEIRYISKLVNKGKPVNMSIPKSYFPAGISQITLFDGQGTAVCERLIFIQQKEQADKTTMHVEKSKEGDDLVFTIKLTDSKGKAASGNLSLSLYENTPVNNQEKWTENIVSNLLLTSDLQGKVENATDYFNEKNADAPIYLDYVMMVNGWRRFIWKEVLAGQYSPLIYSASEGLNQNEIAYSNIKPETIDLTEKLFPIVLNEQYDTKIIKKNTRELAKSTPKAIPADNESNTVAVNHQTLNSYSDMIQFLKGKVAGVAVSDNGIKIRGVNTFMAGTDPLILQENTPITFSTLKMISPNEVAKVEVLKNSDASFYGSRGANGVIIIHMRSGKDEYKQPVVPMEQATERIISFYKAREFYVPAYDSWDKKPNEYNVPRSVFWKPDIAVDSTGVAIVKYKNRGDVDQIKTSVEGMADDGSVLFYETVQ